MRTALMAFEVTAKYRYNVSPSTGRFKTGGYENARLRCCSAFSHSSVHSNIDSFLSSLNKGNACWADFTTKRDKAVSIPFRDCIDIFKFGVGNSKKALHFFGLASIPRSVK
ncbi:hypothetical protein A2U01_0022686 [Trifolium medium]|uniref:Uncharacterized protein n=1 Tax=Trifolium medium TaxID=97028 RepID=A0A392NR90_9FABA|nr:hypothetical protein [Trifolium medium]